MFKVHLPQPFSRTFCVFLPFLVCKFESNTTSEWLNDMVKPIKYYVSIKCLLTLYQTILTFNDPKEEGFGKHCRKRRKCW